MTDDLEQIIADQMAQIEELRADLAQADADLAMAEDKVDTYYETVYNNIRAAWDKWALAELGTASPSPLDLQGRPELSELWEAVR
jgi:predicted phage gp36 major capsid-like protein